MIRQAPAVEELARLHLQALHIGSEVTQWFRKDREPHVLKVTPENVVAALNKHGIKPVLMGTHGLNVYRDEARATQDVDVLVTKRNVRKAARVLEEEFPYLEVFENASVVRFLDPVTQKVVLDVMKPSSQAIQIVFRHTVAIGDSHRIPDLEMAMASKLAAMCGANRRLDKRMLDRADFTNMALTNRAILNLDKLKRLAAKVHPKGGAMIEQLIADIDAGRDPQLPPQLA
jgi:hypothetical protein